MIDSFDEHVFDYCEYIDAQCKFISSDISKQ